MARLLEYISDGKRNGMRLVEDIDQAVCELNENEEWVDHIMTMQDDTEVRVAWARKQAEKKTAEEWKARAEKIKVRALAEGKAEGLTLGIDLVLEAQIKAGLVTPEQAEAFRKDTQAS